jgi:hypothetical protein
MRSNKNIVLIFKLNSKKPSCSFKHKKRVTWKPKIQDICPNTISIKNLSLIDMLNFIEFRSNMWNHKVQIYHGMWENQF